LKDKSIKEIKEELMKNFDCDFSFENLVFESGIVDDKKIIFIDNEPCFLYHKSDIVFTLFGLDRFKPKNRFIIVDMGAVKFVVNGADVMSPGIVDADEQIKKGDQVWICDEKNKKPLAVGFALIDGIGMKNKNEGRAVKAFLYVGDKLYNTLAKSL
jgi:PUA domain protein